MASYTDCDEFFRVFNYVDKWLKSDGNDSGYLFVPQFMRIDRFCGQQEYTKPSCSDETLSTTEHLANHSTQNISEIVPEKEIQHHDIDPEYLEAVLINRRHVEEREMMKKRAKIVQKEDNIQYVEISQKETLNLNAKRKSTTEKNTIKRRKLYNTENGDDLKRIETLENELQAQFDKFMKINRPKLWPCIPVRLNFED